MSSVITDDDLVTHAMAARARSYSPYSEYAVGAAVIAGGRVYEAANVENASYGLSLCAERNAIVRAVLDGHLALERVAVVTDSSPPAAPCGMCLQTMAEFTKDPKAMRVLLVNPRGERRVLTLAELLPHGFTPIDLERR
jgi:cytidine deaminase